MFVNQVLPVWVHKSLLVRLRVADIRLSGASDVTKGITCAFMTSSTELVVAPKLPQVQRSITGEYIDWFYLSLALI